ncbi:MAG: M23 family metallopeptidase, partial [Microlunatus sp.]|nr:M23 family metallopeptidase [Microlunatus sp.]
MTKKHWAAIAAVLALGSSLIPAGFIMLLMLGAAGGGAAAAACAQENTGAGVVVVDAGGPVRLPITGRYVVMSEFNPARLDPVDGRTRPHKGIDVSSTPAGADVVAMKAGVVTFVGPEPWGALTVEMDHGGGLTSRYLHLARWTVSKGQKVNVGDRIGIEGSTGHSTGPHLHWEVRESGQLLNPRVWAGRNGIKIPPTGSAGLAPPTRSVTGPSGSARARPTMAPSHRHAPRPWA